MSKFKIELKPCPFCGSAIAPTVMDREEACWIYSETEKKYGEREYVVCCAGKKDGCGASTGFHYYDDIDEAIKDWNRRVNEHV